MIRSTLLYLLISNIQWVLAQTPGKLFIIGGGNRPATIMQGMMATADLKANEYIVVLTMSSSEPDTSFYYIKEDLLTVTTNRIAHFSFIRDNANNIKWLDSLKQAKLIFITGGDQTRFMNVVLGTPIYAAIHQAYQKGATVAGTSAGAAVMSKQMITGNQIRGDTVYHSTFDRLWNKNIEFAEGLGLLENAIIDQHFLVRSRHNRLISALEAFPEFIFIGIDEETAIAVQGNKARVIGESQVVVLNNAKKIGADKNGLIKIGKVNMAVYTPGESFKLK